MDAFFWQIADESGMQAQNPTILCLDDEPDNLDAIERLVRNKYRIIKTTSPDEALKLLKTNSSDIFLILSDQKMPTMSGVDFLKESLKFNQTALRVLLTGYSDIETVIKALNEGQIYKYISKPWEPHEFILNIDKCFETYELRSSLLEKNKQLEKALLELQGLDQTKNQFMVLINHELKTPLTSIISFTDLLRDSQLSDEQKLFLERISNGSEKLKSIIDDVLLFMRSQMGQILISPTEFMLSEAIEQSLAPHKKEIDKKSITIDFSVKGEKVTTDRRILTQILTRIFHNAIKFSNPKSTIHLSYKSNELCISNKGPQIKNEIIEKIYEPFFLDENIMNHTTGIGMGLSISNSLLKTLKSKLRVQNSADGVLVSFKL